MVPFISVVIVTFNGKKFLEDCLSSLTRQTFRDFEIILVDNGSSDGTAEYIRKQFPLVILIESGKNLGFSGGTNAGIRAARGEFIFTLNNDTIACSHTLKELIQPMLTDPKVGMCGTKMIFPDHRINSTAICISKSGAAWDRGMGERDCGQYDVEEEVFGPCAGAALYRRTMLDEIGLFDEDFFLFLEDVDLAFRGRLAGWKCMYVPTARVIHFHGGTAGYQSDISVYYYNRNIFWYVIKNFPSQILLVSSPWIIGRNLAAVPYYLLRRKGLVILRSKISMLQGVPKMIRKRHLVKRNVPEKTIEKWLSCWCHATRP